MDVVPRPGGAVSGGERPAPRIDVHVHLAGVGTDGSGCWISPAFEKRITFRLLRARHGMSAARPSADADWAADVAERVRGSELTHAVALGFDGVYRHGALDRGRSQMIVPAEWVFRVCRAHPELLPGPSINPHRADALERLEECIEGGAVLIKWLPATQGIDPADPSLAAFYRRCAQARLPILTHSGGTEGTFAQVNPALKDLRRMIPALRAGVTVIVAHTGAPVAYARDRDQVPLLRTMLDEFPHLWVDNSGMANPARFQHLPRYARDGRLVSRTLHGSDFPVPSNSFWYGGVVGWREVARLERIRNRMQRDIEMKRALGYPEDVLTRAASVLPNLDRWIGRGV